MIKETSYEGYFTSDDGRIYSAKVREGGWSIDTSRIHEMTYKIDDYGYKTVCLSFLQDGCQRRIYPTVHKLVFETFVEKVPKGNSIDHINHNKLDNNLSNLRSIPWVENSINRDMTFHFGKMRVFLIKDAFTSNVYEWTIRDVADRYDLTYKQAKRRVVGNTKDNRFSVLKEVDYENR